MLIGSLVEGAFLDSPPFCLSRLFVLDPFE